MLRRGISRTERGFLCAADICIFGQKCKGRLVGIILPARTSLRAIWDHDRPTLGHRYGGALVWPEREGSTECIPLTHGELARVNRLGHCVTPVPARMGDLGTPHLYGIITAAGFGILGVIPAGGLATCDWDLPREDIGLLPVVRRTDVLVSFVPQLAGEPFAKVRLANGPDGLPLLGKETFTGSQVRRPVMPQPRSRERDFAHGKMPNERRLRIGGIRTCP